MVPGLSVVVVAGNEVLARGIEAVLLTLPGVASVRTCDRSAEIGAVDVLIGRPEDGAALEAAKRAGATVLALLDDAPPRDLARYAALAVDGFLSRRDLTAQTLRDALHRARNGEVPMPPVLVRALIALAETPARTVPTANLTSREIEALRLLVGGLSNKQIARHLAISSHGAKRLVASIMLKLDSPNRTTAAVTAIRAGIVDARPASAVIDAG
jgi:DNA-binding NarL/FixJ family response regulator